MGYLELWSIFYEKITWYFGNFNIFTLIIYQTPLSTVDTFSNNKAYSHLLFSNLCL